jgi:Flp pilus assembly pilin Flp
MTPYLKQFISDETGTATLDWVLLTGLALSLTLALMTSISTSSQGGVNKIVDLAGSQSPLNN